MVKCFFELDLFGSFPVTVFLVYRAMLGFELLSLFSEFSLFLPDFLSFLSELGFFVFDVADAVAAWLDFDGFGLDFVVDSVSAVRAFEVFNQLSPSSVWSFLTVAGILNRVV